MEEKLNQILKQVENIKNITIVLRDIDDKLDKIMEHLDIQEDED